MAIKRTTIREELTYWCVRTIAEAVVERSAEEGAGRRRLYWGYVQKRWKEAIATNADPASILRQNLQLVERAGSCAYCGGQTQLQWDHIVPRSRRGPDTIDNLVRACQPCNGSKSDTPVTFWAATNGIELPRMVLMKYFKTLWLKAAQRDELERSLDTLEAHASSRARLELSLFAGDE